MQNDTGENYFRRRKNDIQDNYDKGVYNHDRWEREMKEALLCYGAVHPQKAKKEAKIMGVEIDWKTNPYRRT